MVRPGPSAYIRDTAERGCVDDQLIRDDEVAARGDRPTDLRLGEGASEADLSQPSWTYGVPAPPQKEDGLPHTV